MNKMAANAVKDKTRLNLPKTFQEISSLTKPKLKQICTFLAVDFEKSFGKKSLVNIVSSALNIPTSGPAHHVDLLASTAASSYVPTLNTLQKLSNWHKNLDGVNLVIDETVVKEFLIGAGYQKQVVQKYKTLRAWEHKQGIHSVK